MSTPSKSKAIRTLGCFFCFCMLAACSRSLESSLRPPETPLLSGGLGWALVKESYVRLKEKPTSSASDIDHLRKGGVFEIEERVIGSASSPADKGLWYRLKVETASGWVHEGLIDVYTSKAQAERAAALMKR